jgi:hypothetical protein
MGSLPRTFVACGLSTSLLAIAAAASGAAGVETSAPQATDYFAVEVVDDQTGRGVPLVELRTVDSTRYYTDSAGIVAFHEPELMDQKVFFYVSSHGYDFPADGFKFRGQTLDVTPGGKARLPIKRTNIAERLYRVTGAGIYRDSVLVGRQTPISHPLINAHVTGSDSVQSTLYRGRLFWFWGDTNRPRYPLGNFQVPMATSRLPKDGGLDPAVGVDLEYAVDEEGFAKRSCEMPGDGPTWIDGLAAVKDATGREELFAAYVKVRGFLDVYQRGIVRFDDSREQFSKVTEFDLHAPVFPHGHSLRHKIDDQEFVYFGNPYPLVRVPARAESVADLTQYEAFTCLSPGSRFAVGGKPGIAADKVHIERDAAGRVAWAWRKDAPPVGPKEQERLVAGGKLRPHEAPLQLRDVATGRRVTAHAGSVAWNDHRRAWVMIAEETGGTSLLGEIWYAEADSPLGPWVYARKVVTHDNYSFYNPAQHPQLAQAGGRLIYFEGTYSTFFTNNLYPTPRYDYNQIMYRLDLEDPWLALPAPVYRVRSESGAESLSRSSAARYDNRGIVFFAATRPADGLVPIFASRTERDAVRLSLRKPEDGDENDRQPLCYALPVDMKDVPATTEPLYECTDAATGAIIYSTVKPAKPLVPAAAPLCRVWTSPMYALAVRWE